MNFARQVSQMLDEEHRSVLDLLGRVERGMARGGEAELPALAGALRRQLEQEVGRHFGFEEAQLFPRMAQAGDGDLASLLTEEHESIRAVAEELLPLAREAAAARLDPAALPALRRLSLELVERMEAHIQKETLALLPLLEDLLDEDADRELALAYASA